MSPRGEFASTLVISIGGNSELVYAVEGKVTLGGGGSAWRVEDIITNQSVLLHLKITWLPKTMRNEIEHFVVLASHLRSTSNDKLGELGC